MPRAQVKLAFSILLAIILIGKAGTASGQGWQWAAGSTSGGSEGWLVAADAWGNSYVGGASFTVTNVFGPYTLYNDPGIVAKYDTHGNLIWVNGIEGATPIGISADNYGNLYFFGFYYNGSITVGTYTLTATPSDMVYFLAKYNAAGNVVWAKNISDAAPRIITGYGADIGGATTDSAGNVYICAPFARATMTIGSTTLTNANPTGVNNDIFLAKIDSGGNNLWALGMGGTGDDMAYGIAATRSGNVYMSAMAGTGSFPFGATTVLGSTMNLFKVSTNGVPKWVNSAGSGSELVFGVATNAQQDAYMVGAYWDASLTLGSVTLLNPLGYLNGMLIKYDSAGNVQWAKEQTGDWTNTWSVAADPCGNVWISGSFDTSVTIDGHIFYPPPGGSAHDQMFMAGYTSTGANIYATALASGGDDNNGIATDGWGNLYMGGDYEQTMVLASDTFSDPGEEAMFIAKYQRTLPDTSYLATPLVICDSTQLHAPPGFMAYLWDDGSTSATRKVATAGTYWVMAIGSCTQPFLIDTFKVTIGAADTTYKTTDTGICGGSAGIVLHSLPGYTVNQWNTGSTADSIAATDTGRYWAIETSGCATIVDTFNVRLLPLPVVSLGGNLGICAGNALTLSAPQGTGYTYLWSTGSTASSLTVTAPGTYWLRVGSGGCYSTDTAHVSLIDQSGNNHLTNVTPDVTILYGSNVQLNSDNEYIYYWKPNDGSLSNANINNPIAAPLHTTVYTVYGYDMNGCLDSASLTVTVDSTMYDCIPQAFTPNGDNLNDIFRPTCITFQKLVEFSVYNRWGQRIFHTNDMEKGWDGTFNGTPQDMDVYYYIIIIAHPGEKNRIYKGSVTLIR